MVCKTYTKHIQKQKQRKKKRKKTTPISNSNFPPTGEISAISNCTTLLSSPLGPYNFSLTQTSTAFSQLSLYTNAESCPMCASAIRWAGFKEYIYGTSIDTLIEKGWRQIRISSREVFEQAWEVQGVGTRFIGGVLGNETDGFFGWQFDPQARCPEGCGRRVGGGCGVV